MIREAYNKLDKNRDGRVTLEDLANTFDVSQLPEVQSGKVKPEEVFKAFISNWDTKKRDGIITLDEFVDYYKDVSALIEKDENFVEMMKSTWDL